MSPIALDAVEHREDGHSREGEEAPDLIGLTVLSEPPNGEAAPKADVVFVHGLTGDATATWTFTNNKTHKKICWPKDILPQERIDVRIITYGYDAGVTNGFNINQAPETSLASEANTFLETLVQFRAETHSEHRPLIFIGHSLGGLVIERALLACCDASEERQDVKSIFNSTKVVSVLGTPHKGSVHAKNGNKKEEGKKNAGLSTGATISQRQHTTHPRAHPA